MLKYIKNITVLLFILFSIIGFISIILILIGYRPVIGFDTKPNWEAISSISTILAVFTALFITKWEDMLSNKKKLKIGWRHIFIHNNTRITYFGFVQDYSINEIVVEFTNIGNRKIILSHVYIKLNKINDVLFPEYLSLEGQKPTMTFPCEIEPEIYRCFYIRFSAFIQSINIFLKDKNIKENNNIIIVAVDTTGKEYTYNTKLKYQLYLDYIAKKQ